MQSHIQMPKVVLKEFVNEEKYYFKCEVATGKITKGYPKRTYTQEDYYSEEMETAFNQYIETPLKSVIDFAKCNLMDLSVVVNEDVEFNVYNYIRSLIARSERLLRYANESSVYLQFMEDQSQHDWIADYAMNSVSIYSLEKEFSVSFIVNDTTIPFVLPTCGLYECKFRGQISIIAPITPFRAIWLVKCDDSETKERAILSIDKDLENAIRTINRMLFQKQISEKVGYVVSSDESMLKELKAEIEAFSGTSLWGTKNG